MLHEEFNQHLRIKLPQTLAGFVAQSFCGEKEVSDESPVLGGQLSVAFRQVSELLEML